VPTLETAQFSLTLEEDWMEVAGDTPDRYVFECALHDASLTITVEPMLLEAAELDEVARKLADRRLETHLSAAQNHGWLFDMVDPVIIPQDWGRMVAYHGRLHAGGAFSYVGLTLPTGVVGLFVESDTATADALDALLGEVAGGMAL